MLTTELTRRLGIDHPIVQAGMADAAGRDLVLAVSKAGALGTMGTLGRSPHLAVEEIAAIRSATDRPFAVNLLGFEWAPTAGALVDAVIESRPPIVTISFGDPLPVLRRCQDAGITTIVQVQDVEGLRAAIDSGADFLVVQGNEAGGHTGWRGTLNFVAQALDMAGSIPVLAAGGVGNGRGLAAALAMGCAGVVMGTRFKATPEFLGNDKERQEIVDSDGSNTTHDFILDIAIGIQWANGSTGRALRSGFTEEWHGRDAELREKAAAYPMFGFAQELAAKGQALNFAGESSGLVDRVKPAAEVVADTVREAEQHLLRVREILSPAASRA